MPTQLSPHFSLEELTATQQRMDNTPTPEIVAKLTTLANELLEPVRALTGALHCNSGYRSPEVNAAVNGAKNSQHVLGEAADLIPLGISKKEMAHRIIMSDIQYDQLIVEYVAFDDNGNEGPGGWIHVSIAPPERPARRQALIINKSTNGHYLPYKG